jgi:hypothetical protein
MLVLGDRVDLIPSEATEPDTVFESYHLGSPAKNLEAGILWSPADHPALTCVNGRTGCR